MQRTRSHDTRLGLITLLLLLGLGLPAACGKTRIAQPMAPTSDGSLIHGDGAYVAHDGSSIGGGDGSFHGDGAMFGDGTGIVGGSDGSPFSRDGAMFGDGTGIVGDAAMIIPPDAGPDEDGGEADEDAGR